MPVAALTVVLAAFGALGAAAIVALAAAAGHGVVAETARARGRVQCFSMLHNTAGEPVPKRLGAQGEAG